MFLCNIKPHSLLKVCWDVGESGGALGSGVDWSGRWRVESHSLLMVCWDVGDSGGALGSGVDWG